MTFPLNPERGVDRYEVWSWDVDEDGGGCWQPHSSSNNLKLVRRDLYNLTLLGCPGYIFTRRRGKVIESNKEELMECEAEDQGEAE